MVRNFRPSYLKFKCSCERLESLGIPCEHLVAVMVDMGIVQLPECVVLKRWTKYAKDSIPDSTANASSSTNPDLWSKYLCLVEHCNTMCKTAYECGRIDYMCMCIDMVRGQTDTMQGINAGENTARGAAENTSNEGLVRDPARVRRKGSGGPSSASQSQGKQKETTRKAPKCGACRGKGHERNVCPFQSSQTQDGCPNLFGVDHDANENYDTYNVDMVCIIFLTHVNVIHRE